MTYNLKKYILTLALIFIGTQAEAQVYNAETDMLPNGMQVVVIPNHRAPVVTHMLWYKVGSADEPRNDGVSGAAHFLEHLMFKGTKAQAPGQFSKVIKSIGGEDNAFTSWDYTAYFQSISTKYLPLVMAMEADRMINIVLPVKDVESERDVIIEERRMRTDNDPQALFQEKMRKALFVGTPYAEPIIGWKDEMPKLTRANVSDYYQTWYAPNNAILVVSGDVTLDEVMPLARKYYGYLPKKEIPDHVRPMVMPPTEPQKIEYRDATIRQPVLVKAWRAPSYMLNKKDGLALDVLMEYLDGGASTILYQTLVVQKKIASSIDLSYSGDARGEGSVWLYATPAPNISLDILKENIDAMFLQLKSAGFENKDIEQAKTRIIDAQDYARDSVAGPAMVVGQALSYGMTLQDVETWPSQIALVKKDDVKRVFSDYLLSDKPAQQPVIGYLMPAQKGGK